MKKRAVSRKYFAFMLSKEKILEFKDASPEEKLIWLKEANNFIDRFLSPKKRAIWEKLRRGQI